MLANNYYKCVLVTRSQGAVHQKEVSCSRGAVVLVRIQIHQRSTFIRRRIVRDGSNIECLNKFFKYAGLISSSGMCPFDFLESSGIVIRSALNACISGMRFRGHDL